MGTWRKGAPGGGRSMSEGLEVRDLRRRGELQG